VWVDARGRLHLKITRTGSRWECAEVICTRSLGYGTYRFYLDSEVHALDPKVVLGLFTWSDTPDFGYREIDIEFARFQGVTGPNGYYTIRPHDPGHPQYAFVWPAERAPVGTRVPLGAGATLFSQCAGISPAAVQRERNRRRVDLHRRFRASTLATRPHA
jgi:hypothetical protein